MVQKTSKNTRFLQCTYGVNQAFESISELLETVLNYLQLLAMGPKLHKYLSSDALQPFSRVFCLILRVV